MGTTNSETTGESKEKNTERVMMSVDYSFFLLCGRVKV